MPWPLPTPSVKSKAVSVIASIAKSPQVRSTRLEAGRAVTKMIFYLFISRNLNVSYKSYLLNMTYI